MSVSQDKLAVDIYKGLEAVARKGHSSLQDETTYFPQELPFPRPNFLIISCCVVLVCMCVCVYSACVCVCSVCVCVPGGGLSPALAIDHQTKIDRKSVV